MALDDFLLDIGPLSATSADLSTVIPAGAWRLMALSFFLTTSAVAATRATGIQIINALNNLTVFYSPSVVTQAASLAQVYVGAKGLPSSAALLANNNVLLALPTDIIVVGGDTLKTVTGNIQAGDAFTNFYARLERLWRP